MNTRIERMRLADLKLLELNARYMRHETYLALVENIRRDGALTSVPFAWRDPTDGRYLVLSGNHRVTAAIEAGIEDGDVMVTDDPLPRSQRVAIQLSHNALAGEDDPATLRLLYEELESLDWRDYSGLDDKTLDLLATVETDAIAPVRLDFLTVVLLLLPDERVRLEAAFAAAREIVSGDAVYLARIADYDRILDGLDLAGKAHGVTNVATSLGLILDVFDRHRADLATGWRDDDGRKRWVPLASILGTMEVPPAVGKLLLRAIERMKDAGDVTETNRWQALEYWAADYLAGNEPTPQRHGQAAPEPGDPARRQHDAGASGGAVGRRPAPHVDGSGRRRAVESKP